MVSAPRLADVLGQVVSVDVENDGALTVRHDDTFASLRMVMIADGLEMISLTQMLAWDLTPDMDLRKTVAAQAAKTMLGTVTMVEHPIRGEAGERADVVLRYNFPVAGLNDEALQTLVMMVLALPVAYAQQRTGDDGAGHRGGHPARATRLAAAAIGAGAEQLDGVVHIGEAVVRGHLCGPRLDLAAADLHRRPAGAAHQVMVMMRCRAAPVHRFPGIGAHHIDEIRGRQ